MEVIIHIAKELLLAWRQGGKGIRAPIIIAALFATFAFLATLAGKVMRYDKGALDALSSIFGASAAVIAFSVYAYRRSVEEAQNEQRVERAEQRAQENPDQPQAAWDLARIKLESYLNRNLSQVRSIFWLTAIVMIVGFVFIGYGIAKAFDNVNSISPALLSTAAGLLINFIGASFLVLYKSTMEQSKEYVAILERINAVGMSVQVLEKIDGTNNELRNTTTAELSKQLLALYQSRDYKA